LFLIIFFPLRILRFHRDRAHEIYPILKPVRHFVTIHIKGSQTVARRQLGPVDRAGDIFSPGKSGAREMGDAIVAAI
jgi:hypothetical protein